MELVGKKIEISNGGGREKIWEENKINFSHNFRENYYKEKKYETIEQYRKKLLFDVIEVYHGLSPIDSEIFLYL